MCTRFHSNRWVQLLLPVYSYPKEKSVLKSKNKSDKIVHPPSTLPRLLILFPRLLRPPSIFLLALRKVMVAWLAVLNDILVFILGACMSLLLSLRSKGGGSLIASSSWSGFKGRLNPIHQKERNVQQLIQWNLFKRHIFTSLWNPFDQVQLLIKVFSNYFFFAHFENLTSILDSWCLYLDGICWSVVAPCWRYCLVQPHHQW